MLEKKISLEFSHSSSIFITILQIVLSANVLLLYARIWFENVMLFSNTTYRSRLGYIESLNLRHCACAKSSLLIILVDFHKSLLPWIWAVIEMSKSIQLSIRRHRLSQITTSQWTETPDKRWFLNFVDLMAFFSEDDLFLRMGKTWMSERPVFAEKLFCRWVIWWKKIK